MSQRELHTTRLALPGDSPEAPRHCYREFHAATYDEAVAAAVAWHADATNYGPDEPLPKGVQVEWLLHEDDLAHGWVIVDNADYLLRQRSG